MKIETKEQALAAIAEVVRFLEAEAAKAPAEKDMPPTANRSAAGDLARDMCADLLDAASCWGTYGCQLCRC